MRRIFNLIFLIIFIIIFPRNPAHNICFVSTPSPTTRQNFIQFETHLAPRIKFWFFEIIQEFLKMAAIEGERLHESW